MLVYKLTGKALKHPFFDFSELLLHSLSVCSIRGSMVGGKNLHVKKISLEEVLFDCTLGKFVQ